MFNFQSNENDLTLVENYSQVVSNAKVFLDSLEISGELRNKLSYFRHWYYFEEHDSYAPSKFIMYRNVTLELYLLNTMVERIDFSKNSDLMDGRVTVKHMPLKDWFTKICQEDYCYHYRRLEALLSKYSKKPNKIHYLYVRK